MEPIQLAMIVALIISVVIHEMAHGFAADALGDPTARLSGRLSPNPLVHIDPIGSVLVPLLMIFGSMAVPGSAGFIFGWAKPVPYNPYNFRNQKWGEALVAAAGPASNIAIALIFVVILQFEAVLGLSPTFVQLSFMVIVLNIFLALFNLIPIPPLDGSKILPRLLPVGARLQYHTFRRYFELNPLLGFMAVIIIFMLFLSRPLYEFTFWVANLLLSL